jgi:hypothetical protein
MQFRRASGREILDRDEPLHRPGAPRNESEKNPGSLGDEPKMTAERTATLNVVGSRLAATSARAAATLATARMSPYRPPSPKARPHGRDRRRVDPPFGSPTPARLQPQDRFPLPHPAVRNLHSQRMATARPKWLLPQPTASKLLTAARRKLPETSVPGLRERAPRRSRSADRRSGCRAANVRRQTRPGPARRQEPESARGSSASGSSGWRTHRS